MDWSTGAAADELRSNLVVRWAQSQYSKDCGAACLATVALQYGIRLDLDKLITLAETSRQGARLDKLRDAAHSVGFLASCGRVKRGALPSVPTPFIAHLERAGGDHYVVVTRFVGTKVSVIDPAAGPLSVSGAKFQSEFSGFALLLKPGQSIALQSLPFRGKRPLSLAAAVVRDNLSTFLLALFSAILLSCASLAAPLFLRLLIDFGGSHHPATAQILLGLPFQVFALIALIRASLTLLKQLYIGSLGHQVERVSLAGFLSSLPETPISVFERFQPSDLVSRVNDSVILRAAVSGPLLSLTLDLAYLLISSALLGQISGRLFLVVALFSALSFMHYAYVRPLQLVEYRLMRTAVTVTTGAVLEAVHGIKTIKTFATEETVAKGLKAHHASALASFLKGNKLLGWASSAGVLINGTGLAVLIYEAEQMTGRHLLTTGQVAYVLAVSSLMMGSIESIVNAVTGVEEAATSAKRLAQLEEKESGYNNPVHDVQVRFVTSALSLRQVSFAYPQGELGVDSVSLEVLAGETIGIRGESGCGKSTLAMLCNGIYRRTSGSIVVLDRPLDEWHLVTLRRTVSIVYSENSLTSGTVRDNLTLGLAAVSERDLLRAASLAKADRFIASLPQGYSYHLGHMGHGLSSGQRQRLALARAFLARPPILILDEATSNLDVETEDGVLAALLKDREGLTTILISHRPETLKRVTRVYQMKAGRLCEAE